MEKILLRSFGDLGTQIMGTAVAKQIKTQHPNSALHVQTSYPEAFANLPAVDKYFPASPMPYFYDEHRDFEILHVDPYSRLAFRSGKQHVIDAWCDALGFKAPAERRGTINLTRAERDVAARVLSGIPQGAKVVAVQFFGGTPCYSPDQAQDPTRTRHYQSLPVETAQAVVDEINKLGMIPLQIGLHTEPVLKNCMHVSPKSVMGLRFVCAVLEKCSHLIAIDSFAQHAWAALGKDKALVLWGGTNPVTLGYLGNTNLTAAKAAECKHCGRPDMSMGDVSGNGNPWQCPGDGACMAAFTPTEIVETFKGLIGQTPQAQEPKP